MLIDGYSFARSLTNQLDKVVPENIRDLVPWLELKDSYYLTAADVC